MWGVEGKDRVGVEGKDRVGVDKDRVGVRIVWG